MSSMPRIVPHPTRLGQSDEAIQQVSIWLEGDIHILLRADPGSGREIGIITETENQISICVGTTAALSSILSSPPPIGRAYRGRAWRITRSEVNNVYIYLRDGHTSYTWRGSRYEGT